MTMLQKCFSTVWNSFNLPRDAKQQLAARNTIYSISYTHMVCSALILVLLTKGRKGEYGRFAITDGSRINVPGKIAFFCTEIQAFAVTSYFLAKTFNVSYETVPVGNRILLTFFWFHYFNRTFLYSLQIRGGKPMTLSAFILGSLFSTSNAFLTNLCLTQFDEFKIQSMASFNFIAGVMMWITGVCINIHSDAILRNLRKPNESEYRIPFGGLFKYVTSANYFGECIEWLGFALAASGNKIVGYSWPMFTFANLFPRAVQSHRWYKKKFDNYPNDRKILFPFIL